MYMCPFYSPLLPLTPPFPSLRSPLRSPLRSQTTEQCTDKAAAAGNLFGLKSVLAILQSDVIRKGIGSLIALPGIRENVRL